MDVDLTPLAPRAATVHRLTRAEGFALTGIAPATASDHTQWVRQWIADGRHGEMDYLARRLDMRLDPTRLLPGAATVIVVADFYHPQPQTDESAPAPPAQEAPRPRGRVASYALGDDYHKVMTKRLHRVADALREQFPEAEFRCTVDTAPILEREHAERAGMGWCGKHTLLIHPRFGSWMLLGTIVTTLKLQTTAEAGYPAPTLPPTDHCGSCTRCIDACPTGCIADPARSGTEAGHRTIDATRCISYLTLEHRGPIDPALHAPMGDWLAGCDVCQEVCPFNTRPAPVEADNARSARPTEPSAPSDHRKATLPLPLHPRYAPRRHLAEGLDLEEVLAWSHADRQTAFQGSALKRVKLDMLKRNALIAAGNALKHAANPALRRRIEALANDEQEPELVRTTAQQVLERLADASPAQNP